MGLITVICALVIGIWHPGSTRGFWGGVEGRLLDVRFLLRGPVEAPPQIAILAVDDRDLELLGAFPPPRSAIAAAVDAATKAGARAIALDFLLIGETPEDLELARALERQGRAVLALSRQERAPADPELISALTRSAVDRVSGPTSLASPGAMAPSPSILPSAGLGHVNIGLEPDGALRRMPAAVAFQGTSGPVWVPTLALSVIREATELPLRMQLPDTNGLGGQVELGTTIVTLDRNGALPLVYYGPAGHIPTWPLRHADRAELKDKIVFLGASALGFGDLQSTPFSSMMPGVEAHATLAGNILDGRSLRRDGLTWMLDIMLATGLAALGYGAGRRARLVRVAAASGAVLAISGASVYTAFIAGIWLDGVTILISVGLAVLVGAATRLVRLRTQAANLALYQSPLLSKTLADQEHPLFDGRAQKAVAVFVDIQGFTGISEQLGPEGSASLVAAFHDQVERAATQHNGFVEQFAGDGAMVLFGFPDPDPGDADRSLAFMSLLRTAYPHEAGTILRLTAHGGEVRAGVFGSSRQRHVGVSGDPVNVASRLQDIAKTARCGVVVSDELLKDCTDPKRWLMQFDLRDLGLQALRGRKAPLHLWGGDPLHDK